MATGGSAAMVPDTSSAVAADMSAAMVPDAPDSYGERRLFSYGDRHRRKDVLSREKLRVTQRVVQHGRGDSSIWDRKRIGESDKELLSDRCWHDVGGRLFSQYICAQPRFR